MTLPRRIVRAFFLVLANLMCRVDDAQLTRVPDRGPLIIVANHVNLLEIAVIYGRLLPRPVVGLALADRWANPLLRRLLEMFGAIPLHRAEADVAAFRRALSVLRERRMILIAPEGTRSHHGRLQKAHPGVVLLALHSGAPLLPVVHYGSEGYGDELRRLRRADFHIVVGRPFTLDPGGVRVTREVRLHMLGEIMFQLANLLPPAYRGAYSDLEAASERYLAFPTEAESR